MDKISIETAQKLEQDFVKNKADLISALKKESHSLLEACSKIDKSWSGSTIGYHGSYYHGDFTPPPANNRWSAEWGTMHGVRDNWRPREGGEVKSEIEKMVGPAFKVEDFSKRREAFFEDFKTLKTDILIELSDLEFSGKMDKEKELYSQIESFDVGDLGQMVADYVNSRVPKTKVSRDMTAMLEGTYIPSQMTIGAGAFATTQILEKFEEFSSLLDRFTKQMIKKLVSGERPPESKELPSAPFLAIEKILNKFHSVACQLKTRHANRNTLTIKDEYDVQDLLHALLRVECDDVRAEEWTPSYAGSSTRMDFLLKKEKMVIEVKKASKSLKDKQLGEQLIIDIAHYQTHQDCKTLICFVYDPESNITKREGLINDLQKKHGDMDVKIIIKP